MTADGIEQDATERDDALRTGYRPDSIGTAARLLDVMRNAITGNEVTAGSKEISAILARLHQFQIGALNSDDELSFTIFTASPSTSHGSPEPHHGNCISKDTIPRGGQYVDVDGFAPSSSGVLRIDGQTQMDWQKKYVLIVDRADVDFLNSTCYREGSRIPWESGIRVVTPLNRNSWNLNIEATLSFQKQQQAPLQIFILEHKWTDGVPTEEEALMMLSYGDDSAIPVPAIFLFVPGMPIVVNQNTHQGLKLVNGASYTALDVILDKAHPGHRVSGDTILHFGPPAGILLASETTRDFHLSACLLEPFSLHPSARE